jgi:hypothetical protein
MCAFFILMKTTAITNKDVEQSEEKLIQYNFPEYGLTVEAKNLEEAKKKIESLTEK